MSSSVVVTDLAGIAADADAAAQELIRDAHRAVAGLEKVTPEALSADGLLRFEAGLESLNRMLDGGHVRAAAEIVVRSDRAAGLEGLAARHGCATASQLIEKVAGVSARTARQRVRVAAQAAPRVSETGLPLPASFPATAAALTAGMIGIDAADAITATLKVLPDTVPVEAVDWAESTLVGSASGSDGVAPLSADLIRDQAAVFRDRLDPDGIEPRDDRLVAKRSLKFFRRPDGMLGIQGQLPPAQEAIIVPVFDSFLSPRTAPAFLSAEEAAEQEKLQDPRTRDQQRADILTALCEGAAKTGQTPRLQGNAPTVLVTVSQHDLDTGTGFGRSPGTDQPLPISTVRQIMCDGSTQSVELGEQGQVVAISSKARFFTPTQRKAMIARDGPTCAKPGCPIPAYWAEAHHVIPDSEGGPTEVDNGCLLCWLDHRLVERGEFTVRMVDGRPVFGQPAWYTKRDYFKPHRPE